MEDKAMNTTSERIKKIIADKTVSVPSIVWNSAGRTYIIDFEREDKPTSDEFELIKNALAEVGTVLDNSFGAIASLVVRPSTI